MTGTIGLDIEEVFLENNMNDYFKKKARELGYSRFTINDLYDVVPYDIVSSGGIGGGGEFGGPYGPPPPYPPAPQPVYVGGQGSVKLGWADDTYSVKIFTSSSSVTFLTSGTIEVLVVGPGGHSAGNVTDVAHSGGGGGGEVIYNSELSVTAGTYNVVVGTVGYNSSFSTITARYGINGTTGTGGASGNGYSGGSFGYDSGGGGGASGPGTAGKDVWQGAGTGGPGVISSITGTAIEYGRGGNGTSVTSNTPVMPAPPNSNCGWGGGGGCESYGSLPVYGATSGVVIIKYYTPMANLTDTIQAFGTPVYPIPSTHLRCNKGALNPPSILSWQAEEHKNWTPIVF